MAAIVQDLKLKELTEKLSLQQTQAVQHLVIQTLLDKVLLLEQQYYQLVNHGRPLTEPAAQLVQAEPEALHRQLEKFRLNCPADL
jgi:hypothetical protein